MAKLYSTPLELIALRGMCSRDATVSGSFLSQLDDTHFHVDECQAAYTAILKHVEERGQPPTYTSLVESPRLSKETRALLGEVRGLSKTVQEARDVIDKLNEFRHTRIFYELCMSGIELLKEPTLSVEKMVALAQTKLAGMQINKAVESQLVHLGRDGNAQDHIQEILYGEDKDQYLPTGWKVFDSVNGGLPRGGLVTLGGSSGSGKSHAIVQLGKHQASLGYKVATLPLEMTRDEWLVRILANVSGVDSLRINRKKIAAEERDAIWRAYRRFNRKIEKNGGRYTLYSPTSDVSIEESLAAVHSFNPDVIYIDYLGLLKGADGEDQWRKLGQISRYCKVYAGNHNKIVAVAAQVDDDGRIRYSQAVKEHSSLAFTFVATKESREKGYLNMHMLKGRNQQLMDFTLSVDYATSTMTDLDPADMDKNAAGGTEASDSKSVKKPVKKTDFVPDLDD